MKLICTGDVHIGRRPTRLPADVGRRASAAAAWLAVVEAACERQADAVLLSGDVVDHDNRFFEAFGPLEQGVRTLAAQGIEVLAVAGNHDHDVLPRLAAGLAAEPRFHLVGAGGRWERVTLERDGAPWLHVDGWSFPREHVRGDPLRDHRPRPGGSVPVVGLLHSDVDQAGSLYAPTRLADLQRRPLVAWIVGHVHRPWWAGGDGGAAVLNPGSPQPLDPGEPGEHGAWLVEVDAPDRCTARLLPVARVRYEPVEIDLAAAADRADVDRLVLDAVRERLRLAATDAGLLEHVALRLQLTGRTAVHGALGDWLAELSALTPGDGDVQASVEAVRDHTRPAVDLQDLARGRDPVGHLAALLLALERPEPPAELAELLTRTRRALDEVDHARPFDALRGAEATDEDAEARARAALTLQGNRLLDRLLAQRQVGS